MARRGAPMVALTANAFHEVRARCVDAVMDDFVTKPFTIVALRGVIARLVRRIAGRARGVPGDAVAAEAAKAAAPSTLDAATLERLASLERGDEDDAPARFSSMYRDATAEIPERLEAAVGAQDAPGIRGAAHALKGSSASIGAIRLSVVCKSLEASAVAGDVASGAQALRRIRDEYQAIYRVPEGPVQVGRAA